MRIFWLDRAKAVEALKERAKEYIQAESNVLKVVLFGSLAEGRGVPGSDADILILLEKAEEDFFSRMERALRYFSGLGIGVEVFPYTQEEASKIPLAQQAFAKGIVLAERKESY